MQQSCRKFYTVSLQLKISLVNFFVYYIELQEVLHSESLAKKKKGIKKGRALSPKRRRKLCLGKKPFGRTTCLTDKTNHPVERAESQQIAVWQLLYQVRHPGRHISRLQTIWDLHSAKWMQGRYTQRFRPGIKVPKIGMESEDYPSPSKKGGPTVSLP